MPEMSKSPQDQIADELMVQTKNCVEDLKTRWVGYSQGLPFKAEVSLSTKIELFATPVLEFVNSKYPILLTGPPSHFWIMVFTAVLESETHPADEVNRAIAELETKFRGSVN